MKRSFLILLIVVSYSSQAQQADSLKRSDPKEELEKSFNNQEKESFGDYVQKVGLGIWGKVKERFNLEGVVESLEEKKSKFLGDKNKNEGNNKKHNDPKEKESAKNKLEPDS